jgi:hypothetical protein
MGNPSFERSLHITACVTNAGHTVSGSWSKYKHFGGYTDVQLALLSGLVRYICLATAGMSARGAAVSPPTAHQIPPPTISFTVHEMPRLLLRTIARVPPSSHSTLLLRLRLDVFTIWCSSISSFWQSIVTYVIPSVSMSFSLKIIRLVTQREILQFHTLYLMCWIY